MVKSIGKQSGKSTESVLKKKRKATVGRICRKGSKTISLEWKSGGVTDDESGESMEPMEEVPLKELGESELERLVRGWWREVDSRDEGKHTGRNDRLFVEKMMWTNDWVWQKMKSECWQ